MYQVFDTFDFFAFLRIGWVVGIIFIENESLEYITFVLMIDDHTDAAFLLRRSSCSLTTSYGSLVVSSISMKPFQLFASDICHICKMLYIVSTAHVANGHFPPSGDFA